MLDTSLHKPTAFSAIAERARAESKEAMNSTQVRHALLHAPSTPLRAQLHMKLRLVSLVCLALPLFASLVGCSSDSDVASAEDDVRVKPKGTNAPPSVKIELPKGVAASDLVDDAAFSIDGRSVKIGEEVQVTAGSHEVQVSTPAFTSKQKIDTRPGAGYTVSLAAVRVESDPTENWYGSTNFSVEGGSGSKIVVDSKFVPFTPQRLKLTFGLGLSDAFPIIGAAEGEAYVKNIGDLTDRQSVRVHAPTRELPNCKDESAIVRPVRPQRSGAYAFVDISDNAKPVTFGSGSIDGYHTRYEIKVRSGGQSTHGYLPVSESGKSPVDFTVGRIDVDHVDIDNGTQTIHGTYRIFEHSGALRISGCPTGTGVSVVPGKYTVAVDYQVAEGIKTSSYEVDVP